MHNATQAPAIDFFATQVFVTDTENQGHHAMTSFEYPLYTVTAAYTVTTIYTVPALHTELLFPVFSLHDYFCVKKLTLGSTLLSQVFVVCSPGGVSISLTVQTGP